ncbi:lia operon protein LiaF [Sesbania bispinosa]|nr:lia operon protein LiaF [Sesbania bispinosa]
METNQRTKKGKGKKGDEGVVVDATHKQKGKPKPNTRRQHLRPRKLQVRPKQQQLKAKNLHLRPREMQVRPKQHHFKAKNLQLRPKRENSSNKGCT